MLSFWRKRDDHQGMVDMATLALRAAVGGDFELAITPSQAGIRAITVLDDKQAVLTITHFRDRFWVTELPKVLGEITEQLVTKRAE